MEDHQRCANKSKHMPGARRISKITSEDLLRDGAMVNAPDHNGCTLLNYAIYTSNIEAVRLLLKHGADVNFVDCQNSTPLMDALLLNEFDIAVELLNYNDGSANDCIFTHYVGLLTKQSYTSRLLYEKTQNYESLVEYFVKFSEKIDSKLLINERGSFISTFLNDCCYGAEDFIKCLNLILDFPNAPTLIQRCSNCKCKSRNDFALLLYVLYKRKIKQSDTVTIITRWLDLGAKANGHSVNTALDLFGFGQEVETLIARMDFAPINIKTYEMIFPLTSFVLGLHDGQSTSEVFVNFFRSYVVFGAPVSLRWRGSDDYVRNTVLRQLTYFTLAHKEKNQLLNFLEGIELDRPIGKLFRLLPKVPSLVELSRDRTRAMLKEIHNVQNAKGFRDVVDSLETPLAVKNILRFKKPVYF